MQGNRQDAWTQEEDLFLAETVLRHIRDGKTQLEAFKEVGRELSRTSAACGFRWNATLRNQYEEAIQHARDKRKKTPIQLQQTISGNESVPTNIHEVIQTLEKLHTHYKSIDNHEEINKLVNENNELKQEIEHYQHVIGNIKQMLIKYPMV